MRPECLTTLRPGQLVEITGLESAPQHNGKCGRVESFDAEKQRYIIVVLHAALKVRPKKLKLRIPVWNMDLGNHKQYLAWRGEQPGFTFVNSPSNQISFSLHLPFDFTSFLMAKSLRFH